MMITEVGVIRLSKPEADWYEVTTIERGNFAKSASGARIGIASVAWAELDGIKNASGRLMIYIKLANATEPVPATTPSRELSTVSVINPFFIITVTPLATAIIKAGVGKTPGPRHEGAAQFLT